MDGEPHHSKGETLSHEARLARFDAEIMKGLADVEAGRTSPMDEAFDRLDAYIEELAAKKTAEDKKAA